MSEGAGAEGSLDLDTRLGWPRDLLWLFDRYPRAVWPSHANLGEMTRFWLSVHEQFRQLGMALTKANADLREGTLSPADYRLWYPRRLNRFLGGLESHHTIEDVQFFPLLGGIETRLRRGFDVLEGDHGAIHGAMTTAFESAEVLLRAAETDDAALSRFAEGHATDGDRLLRLLDRHLEDEEDLIVPIILDRGEQAMGFG
ncbi:hemerythrin domain-containing protein [Bauldia sp.]|uniref:hemerythrin domain-containing protein n=1 Tax=Bauldia sp. TaxID=2575872 RepID=UPI003BABBD5E